MFIEQDNVVAGQETFQDEIGFSLFLLVGTQAFGVAEFGNDSDFERHIVGQSFAVFLDSTVFPTTNSTIFMKNLNLLQN